MLKRLRMLIQLLFVFAIALAIGSSGSVYAEGPDKEVAKADKAEIANGDERKVPKPDGQVCGTYFYDKNGNGTQEANEPGVADRIIEVEHSVSGATKFVETRRNGYYCIKLKEIDTGVQYTISVSDHDGWEQTFPTTGGHDVTFAPWNGGPYELISDINFGARLKPAPIGPKN